MSKCFSKILTLLGSVCSSVSGEEMSFSGKKIGKCMFMFSLLMVSACSSFENQGVDLESAKNNPLLVPPCMKK